MQREREGEGERQRGGERDRWLGERVRESEGGVGERGRDVRKREQENGGSQGERESQSESLSKCSEAQHTSPGHTSLSLFHTHTSVCVCVRGGAPRLCAGTVETLVLVQKGPARLLLIADLHVPTRASSLTSCPPLSHPTPEQRKHTHTHTPPPLSVCSSRLHKNVHSGVSSRSPQQHAASWFQPSLISVSLQKKLPTFSSVDVLSLWSLLLLFVNT